MHSKILEDATLEQLKDFVNYVIDDAKDESYHDELDILRFNNPD